MFCTFARFSQIIRSASRLSVETAIRLAVFLANRPGILVRVCEALANAGTNICVLATSDTVDHTVGA
jgi:prephenate dehydratase